MTTKINELTAAMLQNVMGMPNVSQGNTVKTDDATGFSDVLDMATVKVSSQSKVDSVSTASNKSDEAKTARESMDKKSSKEIKSSETGRKDPVNNPEDKTELVKDVADKAGSIKKAVKEALGVTDEEIETAMNSLGITIADLLDPQNVQSLCMELNGIEDSISLLTDATLYDNVKMLCAMALEATQEISNEYGITPEQLSSMLEDKEMVSDVIAAANELVNADDSKVETGDFSEALANAQNAVTQGTEGQEINSQNVDSSNANVQNAVVTDGLVASEAGTVLEDASELNLATENTAQEGNVKVEVTYDNTNGANIAAESTEIQKSATDSETETFKSVSSRDETRLKGRDEGFEHVSRFAESESAQAENVVTSTVTETSFNSVGDVVETVSNYTSSNGNEILNQVTESIKVNYSADTTSMELQLHPASLGTVNMHISSSNGIVTAHILVQNEAVKAALENQLITLQETFEAQGQKVEAVEVSIAGYDLNRGMNSETGNDSNRSREDAFGKGSVRRHINLNELTDEALDEMTEEEMIAADMMARSGNSVDFMA